MTVIVFPPSSELSCQTEQNEKMMPATFRVMEAVNRSSEGRVVTSPVTHRIQKQNCSSDPDKIYSSRPEFENPQRTMQTDRQQNLRQEIQMYAFTFATITRTSGFDYH